MECLQLLPGQEAPPLCQLISLFGNLLVWGEANAPLLMAALGGVALFFALWSNHSGEPHPQHALAQTPKERAEILLRDSVTLQQYQHLLRSMRSPIRTLAPNTVNLVNFVSLPVNRCPTPTWC